MPRKSKSSTPSPAQIRKQTLAQIRDAYAGDDLVSQLFQKAIQLEGTKRDVFSDITSNRRSLRDLAKQRLVSQDDVDKLYPPKKDKDTDESDDGTDAPENAA